jgi:hypothetical protein
MEIVQNNMEIAQRKRAEKSLGTLVRYNEGIMSKKEWIDIKKNNGCIVAKELGNRICFNRIKYNRMSGEEQTEYEKKCNQKVIKYRLYEPNGTFYDISKAEYDYFNSVC